METWEHEGMDSYQMANSEDSFFSSLLNDCGYKYTFSHNLTIVLALALILLLIIVILCALDFI